MTIALTRVHLALVSRRETGATSAEYALMVSFIAIVIIVAVLTLGTKLSSFFIQASQKV